MAKQGEIAYARLMGEAGRWHSANKPFSDPSCPDNLVRIGSLMKLLPEPPGRILDLGCGAGWTSEFLGRRGHPVVGVDIAPDMIYRAQARCQDRELRKVSFVVSDFENLPFRDEFDGALFFDALHHAVDEEAALAAAYRALKPGGVCVTCEPGHGHSQSEEALRAVSKFDVTEKDMPPSRIVALGRRVGFKRARVYPHPHDFSRFVYGWPTRHLPRWTGRSEFVRHLYTLAMMVGIYLVRPWSSGTVVLVK